VNIAVSSPPKFRFTGRSFLAFAIEPVAPIEKWLADLDDMVRRSVGFFTSRPVILDMAGLAPTRDEARQIIDALRARSIRIIAVEGVDPGWFEQSLAPIAGSRETGKGVDFFAPDPGEFASKPRSMVIDRPVRSGQSIFHADGDLTICGPVASGAEIAAAGSIHIYGTLRGRALAGATGDSKARIFCHRFEAELVAIDGCYLTAEVAPSEAIGKPVDIRLDGDSITINVTA
jgi:septum site-determining protein MinC